MIVCIIFLAVYAYPNDQDGKAANSVISYFNKVKKGQAILDIKSKEFRSSHDVDPCDTDYTNVVLSEWPGINTGCMCEESTDPHYKNYPIEYCQSHADCKKIDKEYLATELSPINKYDLCIKYAPSPDVFYKGNQDCPSGHVKCGSYCSKVGAGITSCNLVTSFLEKTSCTSGSSFQIEESIGSNPGKCLELVKSNSADPVILFHVPITDDTASDFEYPCLEKEYLPKKSFQPSYPLLKILENGCGKKYGSIKKAEDQDGDFATHTFKIGKYSNYFTDYQVNDFYSRLFTNEDRPAFYEKHYTDSDTARLIHVKKMKITADEKADICLNDYNDFKIEELSKTGLILARIYKIICIIGIILSTLGLIALIGYIIL